MNATTTSLKPTRMEKITKLNASIEALKARRDEALVRGRLSEARAYAAKAEMKLAERQGYELELYEDYGMTV